MQSKKQISNFHKETLFQVVKTSFQQRRKMLSNSLKNLIPILPEKFKNLRPEQLTIQDFIELSNWKLNLE